MRGWGRQGTGDDDGQERREGGVGGVGEKHLLLLLAPPSWRAQGALLTTNKSTARSNLSWRSVGRGSGV